MHFPESWAEVIINLIFASIGVILGIYIGISTGVQYGRQAAVEAGAAQYVVDAKTGVVQFEYLPQK
jgi:hypothetical protein